MSDDASLPEDAEVKLSERALQHRAEMLVEASKSEPFKMLLSELEKKERRLRRHASTIALSPVALDQRTFDATRGFIEGLHYVTAMVSGAEKFLKEIDAKYATPDEPEEGNEDW